MFTEGTVTGMALSRARVSVGLIQSDLADRVGVSLDLVKSWESGRQPLTRAAVRTFYVVRRELAAAGASHAHLTALDDAAHADGLLHGIAVPEQRHVLAHEVLTRPVVDLMQWPITGRVPRSLGGGVERPTLGRAEAATLHGSLREAAEAATGPRAPMLRRQAGFLLAADVDSTSWLAETQATETRALRDLSVWTPSWPVARGLAIAMAMRGDRDPLLRFVERGLASDDTLAANLAYYAAWVEDDPQPHTSDEFMAEDPGGWRGHKLLGSLISSLDGASPYLDLTIRSVCSLLEQRPWLLDTDTGTAVRERAGRLLDEPLEVAAAARRELEQIVWMAKARSQR